MIPMPYKGGETLPKANEDKKRRSMDLKPPSYFRLSSMISFKSLSLLNRHVINFLRFSNPRLFKDSDRKEVSKPQTRFRFIRLSPLLDFLTIVTTPVLLFPVLCVTARMKSNREEWNMKSACHGQHDWPLRRIFARQKRLNFLQSLGKECP